MSAVLVAVFKDHPSAAQARVLLVNDGFPTDRVDLISSRELGPAKLVPRDSVSEQLIAYFQKVLQSEGSGADEPSQLLQRAVEDGKSVLVVQPRGDVEIQRAAQLLNDSEPLGIRGADLENSAMEHAAAEKETPVITWMGKVLAAPGARDTTGTAKLP